MAKRKIIIPKTVSFLVLDDMEVMREAVIEQLNRMGFKGSIHEAEDVQGARDLIKSEKIEYVLSDWNLPDGTGFEFLEEVRAMIKHKETPFLMITTENGISDILNAMDAGCSNYLIKPWTPKDFMNAFLIAWDKHNKI
jgi:two-component system, chemotaxis family, chemotaxis protein CheY